MEAFWRWLMRANARAVFAAAMLGLAVVLGWWSWREFAPASGGARARTHRKPPRNETVELGLIDYIERQTDMDGIGFRSNPFFVWSPPRPHPRLGDPSTDVRQDRPPRIAGVDPPPDKPPPDKPPPEKPPPDKPPPEPVAPPPPPPEKVTLEYRGVMKRSDGLIVALIHDSKTGRVAFHRPGSRLHGIRIGAPTERGVNMIEDDGAVTRLDVGDATTFEIPPWTIDGPAP